METIEIIDYDHQGRGIGKLNNKTVFVYNALPKEVVEIKVLKEKTNFIEAEVNKIITSSPVRINPICPYFNICGGCDIMHISYEEQLKFKQKKIENIKNRFSNIDFKIKDIISSNDLYYRNKVTLHVSNNKIGYFKEKSNDLIEIDSCILLDKNINKIYSIIKNNMNLDGITSIVIRSSLNISNSMVIIYVSKKVNEQEIINLLSGVADSIIISYNNEFKTIYGNDYILEKLFDKTFIITADSFFQVNTKQTEKLYGKVIEYVDPKATETILDLYCGTGTIGILLSKYAKEVVGIEINTSAVKSANKNKELNKINNISFYAGDTGEILSKHNYHVDTVVVDPPRAGLNELAIKEIFKINPKKIVYVSCDPMTLMRDLNLLSVKYDILELTPVDMFPNTSHVECVCVLKLK